MTWHVGQTVIEATVDRGKTVARSVTITKIGRVWAYYGRVERFDLETGEIDGGPDWGSPGRVFIDESAYNEHVRRRTAWTALLAIFNSRGRHNPPDHLSADQVEEMVKLLKEPEE